jgi:hypothetical protein
LKTTLNFCLEPSFTTTFVASVKWYEENTPCFNFSCGRSHWSGHGGFGQFRFLCLIFSEAKQNSRQKFEELTVHREVDFIPVRTSASQAASP